MRRAARLMTVLLTTCLVSLPAAAESLVTTTHHVDTRLKVRADWRLPQTVGYLQAGESAKLLENRPRWRKIRLRNGREGYVSKSYSEVIDSPGVPASAPSPLPLRQIDELRIHHLPVGAGTCTIVECPGSNAHPMVIDCGSFGANLRGPDDMDKDSAEEYFDQVLDTHSEKPNLIISHPDKDHYEYLNGALGSRKLNQIWTGGELSEFPSWFRGWLTRRTNDGAELNVGMQSDWHNGRAPIDELSCGKASTYVLTVNSGDSNGSRKNGDSLLVAIEYNEFVVTFAGDAEDESEEQAIENFEEALRTTVLSASHHGASTQGSNGLPNRNKGGNRSEWPRMTSPKIVIYSAGTGYTHPRCIALKAYQGSTAPVDEPHRIRCGHNSKYTSFSSHRAEYVTETNGVVTITTDGQSLAKVHCSGRYPCDDEVRF